MGPVVPEYVFGGTTGFKRTVFLMELFWVFVAEFSDGFLGDFLGDSLGGSLGGLLGDSLESSFAAFLHSRDKASNASLICPAKTSDYSKLKISVNTVD